MSDYEVPFTVLGDLVVVDRAGDGRLAVQRGDVHWDSDPRDIENKRPIFDVSFHEFVPLRSGQVGRVVGYERHAFGVGLMGGSTNDTIVQFDNAIVGFWQCWNHRSREEIYLQWTRRAATIRAITVLDLLANL